jgi:hypothetical protein
VSLHSDIAAVLDGVGNRDLAINIIISLVRRATGKMGGRRSSDPSSPAEPGSTPSTPEPLRSTSKYFEVLPMGGLGGTSGSDPDPDPDPVRSESGPSEPLTPYPLPPKPTPKSRRGLPPESDAFRAWYAPYPRHEARADAWKAWLQLEAEGKLPELEKLLSTLDWQIRHHGWRTCDPHKIPLPASYLRGLRFNDERPGIVSMTVKLKEFCSFHEDWRHAGAPAPKREDWCRECRSGKLQQRGSS